MPIKSAAIIALEAEPPGTTWLSVNQVAERYEVAPITVRRWNSYG